MPWFEQNGISSASGARQIMLSCGWEEAHFLAPGRLGGAHAVDVRRIEEVDARVEGSSGAGLGLLALHPSAVGEPRAECDLRHLDLRIAELPEAHGATLLGGRLVLDLAAELAC